MRMVDFARSNRLPFTWRDAERRSTRTRRLCRRPNGQRRSSGPRAASSSTHRRRGSVLRALGSGSSSPPREDVDLLVVGAGPAGLGAAGHGASEGLRRWSSRATALGGQAGHRAGSRTTSAFRPASRDRADRPARSRRRGSSVPGRRRRTGRCRSIRAAAGTLSGWTRVTRSHARTVLIATGAQIPPASGRGLLPTRA